MRNLANIAGTTSGRSISGLLQESQGLINAGTTVGTLEKVPNIIRNGFESAGPSTSASKKDDCTNFHDAVRPLGQFGTPPVSDLAQKRIFNNDFQGGIPEAISGPQSTELFPSRCNFPTKVNESAAVVGRIKFNNIDLNSAYDGLQDCSGNIERSIAPVNPVTGSASCPLWEQSDFHKKNPQMSGNSDSTSQSPSSSNGEAQVIYSFPFSCDCPPLQFKFVYPLVIWIAPCSFYCFQGQAHMPLWFLSNCIETSSTFYCVFLCFLAS